MKVKEELSTNYMGYLTIAGPYMEDTTYGKTSFLA